LKEAVEDEGRLVQPATNLAWRDATPEDKPFLVHLMASTVTDYLRDGTRMAERRISRRIELLARFLPWQIVSLDGVAVGGMSVQHGIRVLQLDCLHVLPEYQQRGIGSAMLQELLATAIQERKEVRLAVLVVNDGAKRLYERHGFHVVRRFGGNYMMRYVPPEMPPVWESLLLGSVRRLKKAVFVCGLHLVVLFFALAALALLATTFGSCLQTARPSMRP
jgi:ribosomal protein S18 acetylase RimI-like enzyme